MSGLLARLSGASVKVAGSPAAIMLRLLALAAFLLALAFRPDLFQALALAYTLVLTVLTDFNGALGLFANDRAMAALQAKNDEQLRANPAASDDLIGLENRP